MSHPGFYKDLGKSANDLLNKGFPVNDKWAWKVELNAPSSCVSFVPSITKEESNIAGQLQGKFKLPKVDATVTADLKGDIKTELVAPRLLLDDLKGTANITVNPQKGELSELKPSVEFSHKFFTTTLSFTTGKSTAAAGTLVVGSAEKGVAVGVEAEVQPETSSLTTLNVTAAYTKSKLNFTTFYRSKQVPKHTSVCGLSFFTKKDDKTSIAVEFLFNAEKGPSVSLGTSSVLNDTATLKSRLNSSGLLGFALTQKLNGPVSLGLGADINLTQNNGPAIRTGVKLALF